MSETVKNYKNQIATTWELPDGGELALGIRTTEPMTADLLSDVSGVMYSIEAMLSRRRERQAEDLAKMLEENGEVQAES